MLCDIKQIAIILLFNNNFRERCARKERNGLFCSTFIIFVTVDNALT